ncbi:hypothetical protein OC835_006369 [Tilletia horrida]|uniref:Uncharacterized protein n=1 Tax=Tilletia horrida TaxID=155126 RepID=A0AAN6GAK9_9BASI|nr:hypothetical protein OC835_006369 [Tilletia horrida]KAK0526454.1 hypothetical protein OC842_005189 [Tilletia horrida]
MSDNSKTPLIVKLARSTRSQSQSGQPQAQGGSTSANPPAAAPKKAAKPKKAKQEVKKDSLKKEEEEDYEALKALARQRGAAVKKEEDDDSEDGEQEGGPDAVADGVHVVNVMCYKKNEDSSPYRQANTVGAQQTAYVSQGVTFDEFLKLVGGLIANFLVNDSKDWDLAVQANGRGHSFTSITKLGSSREDIERTFKRWFAVVESGQEGTLRVIGTRKPTIAKNPNDPNAPTAEESDFFQQLDVAVQDAMRRIWKKNRCKDASCKEKTSVYPWCWPLPGTDRHLNLTVSNAFGWAVALAQGEDHVSEDMAPCLRPYIANAVNTAPSLGKKAGPSKQKTAQASDMKGKGRAAAPEEGKENVPVIELSQSSEEGGVEFISQVIRKVTNNPLAGGGANVSLGGIGFGTAAASSAEGMLPVQGRDMTVRRFARKFKLQESICQKLLDDGYEDASEVAEMTESNFEAANISPREQVKVRAALKKWRLAALQEDGDSGGDNSEHGKEPPTKRQRTTSAAAASGSGTTGQPAA